MRLKARIMVSTINCPARPYYGRIFATDRFGACREVFESEPCETPEQVEKIIENQLNKITND